jgi:hypothetical protein
MQVIWGNGVPLDQNGQSVSMKVAQAAWSRASRPILVALAKQYGSFITYGELSREVQDATGITTTQQLNYWIGEVAFDCREEDEPILSSLVVDANHLVGGGYETAAHSVYGPAPIQDLQMHAAEERLKCHLHFGAAIPAAGGAPTLTPRVAERRRREAKRRYANQTPRYCPNCFLQLPASGICGNCAD